MLYIFHCTSIPKHQIQIVFNVLLGCIFKLFLEPSFNIFLPGFLSQTLFSDIFPNTHNIKWLNHNPKYLSKKCCIFSMTVFFFSCLFPPPNLDIGGSILSMSVPVVLT